MVGFNEFAEHRKFTYHIEIIQRRIYTLQFYIIGIANIDQLYVVFGLVAFGVYLVCGCV